MNATATVDQYSARAHFVRTSSVQLCGAEGPQLVCPTCSVLLRMAIELADHVPARALNRMRREALATLADERMARVYLEAIIVAAESGDDDASKLINA